MCIRDRYEGNFLFEYSPESFTGTEVDYAVEVCNACLLYTSAMVQGKGAGAALRAYRKAQKLCASTPDIAYMPQVCLRVAQYETQYLSLIHI